MTVLTEERKEKIKKAAKEFYLKAKEIAKQKYKEYEEAERKRPKRKQKAQVYTPPSNFMGGDYVGFPLQNTKGRKGKRRQKTNYPEQIRLF